MRLADIETQIPGLREARARENLYRALAFAGVTWTLCGVECVQLTPRHRLELQLGGNAFALGLTPLKGDVFQMLWRLNPAFATRLTRPRAVLAYVWLKRAVRRVPAADAAEEIRAFICAMVQDLPESREIPEIAAAHADRYLHWMASESLFYTTQCRVTFSDYMATPYPVLQQWHRAWRLNHEEAPTFINASDAIASGYLQRLRKGAPNGGN